MTQEEMQKALEAISKSGITVNGDLVLSKHVEYEVSNVEAGGIGIQHVYSNMESMPAPVKGRHNTPRVETPHKKKQHGVDYPVFSKGTGVTNDHIKALYRLLTARGWISTQTNEVDFMRLFSGTDNDCEIIWTGQDRLGNNEQTSLGVSALYVLFKSMADEELITTGTKGKAQRVGPVLESHFVDGKGRFLTNISNVSMTSQVATAYIEQVLKTMRMRPSSEDIQRLLQEDMESRYDKNDRQDLNYRKPH